MRYHTRGETCGNVSKPVVFRPMSRRTASTSLPCSCSGTCGATEDPRPREDMPSRLRRAHSLVKGVGDGGR